VTHSSTQIDRDEIIRAVHLLHDPGDVIEVRCLDARTVTDRRPHALAGYFDDFEKLADAVACITSAKGVYIVANRIDRALLARSCNRFSGDQKMPTTADNNITHRRWLLVDVDPVRPSGVSATDAEKEAARIVLFDVDEWLQHHGFPAGIVADSGNGWHLMFRIELPPDDGGLVKRCLEALAARFDTDEAKIDTTVHNPARIWKLYGTTAAKGDSTADRPHRLARIVNVADTLEVVPVELLEKLASLAPQSGKSNGKAVPGPANNVRSGAFDLDRWIADHNLNVRGPEPWQGGRRWVFRVCPWNPDHTNLSAFIVQQPNGAIGAGCHHAGCQGRGWHELRDAVEPGWRDRRQDQRTSTPSKNGKPYCSAEVIAWQPFPVDAFPEPCRQFISEAARAIGCDPSYVALPLLSGLAAAIGNTRTIRLKPTWDEPSVIWTAIVGDSGTMKSPAVDAPLKPIRKRQEVAFKVHCEAMQRYERDRELHEAAKLAWRKKRNTTEPPPEKPTPPVCDRYWCSDITVEALAARLAHAPRGLLLVRDELAGWLKSFDQYKGGKGGDSAHWLTIHGARDLIVDRKTGDKTTIYVPRAAVSICGGVQPEILRAALGREHFQDGLAARLLLANPRRLPKRWTEANVSHALEIEMANVFAKLWELEPDLDVDGESQPKTLPLTPEAKAAWIEFYDRHGREQAEVAGDLASAFSKLEGYAARLALVLHCVSAITGEADENTVDETSIRAGIKLVEWFKSETRRVYSALAESDDDREQRKLVELIERKGGAITASELAHSDRRFRNQTEAAHSTLNALVDAGVLARELIPSGPKGGPSKEVYRLTSNVTVTATSKNQAKNEGHSDSDTQGEPPR